MMTFCNLIFGAVIRFFLVVFFMKYREIALSLLTVNHWTEPQSVGNVLWTSGFRNDCYKNIEKVHSSCS